MTGELVRRPARGLPSATSVLAVSAHPDDESFGLGSALSAFGKAGALTSVLCFTHGEASSLGDEVSGDTDSPPTGARGPLPADATGARGAPPAGTPPAGGRTASPALGERRQHELGRAAAELGVGQVELFDYADSGLADQDLEVLAKQVCDVATRVRADLLLVFDEGGITGHPDHERATEAALAFADEADLPVLAWAIDESVAATLNAELGTAFTGRPPGEVDYDLALDRAGQLRAIGCHSSQASSNAILWRRLELQGDREVFRWLRSRTRAAGACGGAPRRH